MRLVYIAGPYRSKTVHGVTQNIARAKAIGDIVIRMGHYPLIPHKNTELCEGLADDDFFIKGTMEMMLRCDAVLVTPMWEASSGTRGEIIAAHQNSIPVFFSPHDLKTWLEDDTFTDGYVFSLHGAVQLIKEIESKKNES
jgi:hypothetical protein